MEQHPTVAVRASLSPGAMCLQVEIVCTPAFVDYFRQLAPSDVADCLLQQALTAAACAWVGTHVTPRVSNDLGQCLAHSRSPWAFQALQVEVAAVQPVRVAQQAAGGPLGCGLAGTCRATA